MAENEAVQAEKELVEEHNHQVWSGEKEGRGGKGQSSGRSRERHAPPPPLYSLLATCRLTVNS